ncbi:xylulokinase [Acidisoma cellulosilytica]|uniref:Xylulose kinase n=1 Tax=Acidisoma cellulosilyticum TaxID=2802395 RepID=A0A964E3L9_9PROT|nr:xylulokinase [Acidisoma cellulosilyticum]MCB8880382.1 xylulokinase [Acidisoma cellulosilyticum]
MYLGIDLGTSGIKVVLVDETETVRASHTESLSVSRPQPGWSEQNPEDWWQATLRGLDALAQTHKSEMASVRGIGLSGQMHGAVLLDEAGEPLRPAILWNDTRCEAECAELEESFPALRQVAGNPAMPGFTAPKLLWVRKHETEIFGRLRTVLLPKAYLRYRLTGEMIEEMSDAAGTLWLDVGARAWSDAALAATGLSRAAMPRLVEGSDAAGQLTASLCARWGMTTAPVLAGGAGDNAAGAVGLGAIRPGSAFLSLGTSGVLWATTDRFRPNPEATVHAFCHALPGLWHQMGVTLSAAACLAWWSGVAGEKEAALLQALPETPAAPSEVTFLPYLSGERTPHNDGSIRGAFMGLSQETSRASLTQAVLEGVAFSFRDCLDALRAAGTVVTEADVIGGGSRSATWIKILASVLGITLHSLADGEHGAAFGAARLGRLAATGEDPLLICTPPRRLAAIAPDPALQAAYEKRLPLYRALYPAIKQAQRPAL